MIRVGEKLKEERKKRGLSLEEVAKATKIRAPFLEAIETGQYQKLPGSSYAHGFVKNYVEFFGFPVKEYLAIFRREYNEKENRSVLPQGLSKEEEFTLKRFSLTQAFWIGLVVLLGLFSYLLFQYRAAFWSPALTILSPKDKATISAQAVSVTGTTDANVSVTVNGLPVYIDATGKFTKEIPVFPGNVVLTIKAINSFGKITTIERDITVTP